jgi:hypothetical protein
VKWVVVAFPEHEKDRAKLRALLTQPGDPPMPARYPGAVVLPCHGCAMPLSVGPRSQGALASGHATGPYCPLCAVKLGPVADVANLGNPDSRPE